MMIIPSEQMTCAAHPTWKVAPHRRDPSALMSRLKPSCVAAITLPYWMGLVPHTEKTVRPISNPPSQSAESWAKIGARDVEGSSAIDAINLAALSRKVLSESTTTAMFAPSFRAPWLVAGGASPIRGCFVGITSEFLPRPSGRCGLDQRCWSCHDFLSRRLCHRHCC